MKKILLILIILGGLLGALYAIRYSLNTQRKAASSGPTLSLNTATISGVVGQTFTIGIILNTSGEKVTATELHLTYDSTVVQVTSFTPTNILPTTLVSPVYGGGIISATLGCQVTSPFVGSAVIGTFGIKILSVKNGSQINFASNSTRSTYPSCDA